jgi:hypothetical protein
MHGKTMTDRRNLPFHLVCCLLLFVTGLSAQSLQIIDAEGHSTVLTAIQIANLPQSRCTPDTQAILELNTKMKPPYIREYVYM